MKQRLIRYLFYPITAAIILVVVFPFSSPHLELYRLRHADPVSDAEKAIERGDRRVAAVHLFRTHLPGADSVLGPEAIFQCASWSVSRYTSDVMGDITGIQQRVNGAAMNYATQYNFRLLRDDNRCAPASAPPSN